jgi:glutathione S-transferase
LVASPGAGSPFSRETPMKLHFSRNPNPRLAVAVAKYLEAPVEYSFASPFAPGQAEKFRPLNPGLSVPILEENGQGLWEADAIACRLSRLTGSEFWRTSDDEPDMIRWLSWGKGNFVLACDTVHFERGTKQRYGHGPIDENMIAYGMDLFRSSASLLNGALQGRDWLSGDSPSYADFRMASFLPFNSVAQLPLNDYPDIVRWYSQLEAIEAWRDPFKELDAPELPPIPG